MEVLPCGRERRVCGAGGVAAAGKWPIVQGEETDVWRFCRSAASDCLDAAESYRAAGERESFRSNPLAVRSTVRAAVGRGEGSEAGTAGSRGRGRKAAGTARKREKSKAGAACEGSGEGTQVEGRGEAKHDLRRRRFGRRSVRKSKTGRKRRAERLREGVGIRNVFSGGNHVTTYYNYL